MSLFKLGIILVAIYLLYSCGSDPLLNMNENDVAGVYQPISKSNIKDVRAEFRNVLCAINNHHGRDLPDYRECDAVLHKLVDEKSLETDYSYQPLFANKLRVLIIPGIFGECMMNEIVPFSYAMEHVNKYKDVEVSIFPGIRGRASSKHNSQVINEYLQKFEKDENEKLVIVAYSKGTTDTLRFLDNPDYSASAEKIDAMVSIAGVVNGTPLADDTGTFLKALAEKFPYSECETQDASGIEDLTRRNQFYRLSSQQQPEHIQYYSLAVYTDKENISSFLKGYYERLSLVDPRNDSQVIYYDSILPGARLLGFANADHWAVALPFARHIDELGFMNHAIATRADRNDFPREILLESILRYVDTTLPK